MRDTQMEGYEKAVSDMPKRHAQILGLAKSRGSEGVTAFEVSKALGLPMHSISGRIRELYQQGRLEDSLFRRVNPASGVRGAAWMFVR